MGLSEKAWNLLGASLGFMAGGGEGARRYDRLRIKRGTFPGIGRNVRGRYQILIYHRVLPDRSPLTMAPVSVAELDAHMAMVAKRFRPVSLTRLMDDLDAGTCRDGAVAVTFDDGYRDNYQYAFPILRKHGIPATIFLASDYIGTDRLVWYDQVLHAMAATKLASLDFAPCGIAGRSLDGIMARHETAFAILRPLKKKLPPERNAIIAELLRVCGVGPDSGERMMMDWDEAREMHRAGIDFGGHTMTHPILSQLADSEVEAEMAGGKRAIENALQAPAAHFAYPNGQAGDWNDATMAIARKVGFRCALTTVQGVNGPESDRYALLRKQPWETTGGALYARMLLERMAA